MSKRIELFTTQHVKSSWQGSAAAAVVRKARSRRDYLANKS